MEAALIISGSMPLPESAVCDANAPIANHAMEDEMKLTAFCATWMAMFSGWRTPCKKMSNYITKIVKTVGVGNIGKYCRK